MSWRTAQKGVALDTAVRLRASYRMEVSERAKTSRRAEDCSGEVCTICITAFMLPCGQPCLSVLLLHRVCLDQYMTGAAFKQYLSAQKSKRSPFPNRRIGGLSLQSSLQCPTLLVFALDRVDIRMVQSTFHRYTGLATQGRAMTVLCSSPIVHIAMPQSGRYLRYCTSLDENRQAT